MKVKLNPMSQPPDTNRDVLLHRQGKRTVRPWNIGWYNHGVKLGDWHIITGVNHLDDGDFDGWFELPEVESCEG